MLSRLAITSAILATLVQAGPVIQVSPQTKYQQYDGTGISEAFQRSLVIHELNLASEKIVLDYLFSNTTGAGFTILRNGLGSSPTEGYDLMKSIAPVAPASNSSKVHIFTANIRNKLTAVTRSISSHFPERISIKFGCHRRPFPVECIPFMPMLGVLMVI
jgi:hypothetical protein